MTHLLYSTRFRAARVNHAWL